MEIQGPYRGHVPVRVGPETLPAFYVIRLRRYSTVGGRGQDSVVHDIFYTRHETQDEATRSIELLVKQGSAKSEDFLLLYGHLAVPSVEVTREVIVNCNTTFKQV